MRRRGQASPLLSSVRNKLVAMLAVLSLPLLIISVMQLSSYRRSLNEQAASIARIETTAASGALYSWLEDHPLIVARPETISSAEALGLYQLLRQNASLEADTAFTILDAQGRHIKIPSLNTPFLGLGNFPSGEFRQQWSDGVLRMTGVKRVDGFGWSVAVGVPLPENTFAGRSIIPLALTWALALVASILLGVWAVGRFTKPLVKLAASASTLGEGKLHERVAVETEDEVGALAGSFNIMAERLESKFKEVQTQGAFIEEVLDGLPLGLIVLDASLIVRKVNPTFAGFVGREANALAGRGLYEAAAGLAALSDVVEDVRRTRKPFVTYGLPLNLVARNKTNAEDADQTNAWDVMIWPTTERSAGRGDLILILSEVSKRVRAEKLATSAFAAERTRAAELESVINQMSEGVVIIDRQARYKINPAAAEIIGRKPCDFRDGADALIDDIKLRALDGSELLKEELPLWRSLVGRERVVGEQLQIIRDNGEMRVIAISANPLTGEDGRAEGAVAVFRDITEQVQQHNELLSAYDRLREHDRLKSAFVTSMTHELRTPLNVIIGLCQLLERDRQMPLAPLQQDAVRRMDRNAHALLELVNDLLDYSRLEAGRSALHLEKVDVAEVVKEIVEDYAEETKDKRIGLRMEISPDLGMVTTDRYKLSQVLSNLVGNAIKFTSVGTVEVVAAPLDSQKWYMEVSDTGIGIASDALTYIFDEFRQVDDRLTRSYGGTGLGLAIARKIVELLEGEISVESEPQAGSRFRIIWPRNVRQHTGTGSLVEKGSAAIAPAVSSDKRWRVR